MQDIEYVRGYLVGKRGATEEYPFDDITPVMKVGGKMFAMISSDEAPVRITLKCDPDEAEALRAEFPAVRPGYYMNKAHWNTLTLDGSIPADRVREMMDDSYALVVRSLKKADREALAQEKR